MTVYTTKEFARFARRANLSGDRLLRAAREVESGNYDADLGGGVFKQRVARDGGGKSGGFRAIPLYRIGGRTVFVHGFAKNDKANVSTKELKALKRLADELLGFSVAQIQAATEAGELIEVVNDEGEEEDS